MALPKAIPIMMEAVTMADFPVDTVRKVEFKTCTVMLDKSRWVVIVNYPYGAGPTKDKQPGWLSQVRYATIDDAFALVARIEPLLLARQECFSKANNIDSEVVGIVNAEQSRLRGQSDA